MHSFADIDRSSDYLYPAIQRLEGEPVFRMFVIGTRGAGKTVFLASLYSQLEIQDKRNNYRVEVVSDDHREFLKNKYDEVSNINRDWPVGTAEVTDFEFRCIFSSKDRDFPLFRFRYADFPGGFVTRKKIGENEFGIRSAVRDSHTILVLIDGKKVLNALEGIDDDNEATIHKDFNDILDVVQLCIRRPLQFVVTKHDLLAKYSLAEIRDVLLINKKFTDIVAQRQQLGISTRLIPVSAVGADFAEWDRASGMMRKKRGARAQPYNIDLTLGFAVTDSLLTRFKQQQALSEVAKGTLASMASRVLWLVKKFGGYGVFVTDDFFVLRAVSLLDVMSSKLQQKLRDLTEEIDGRLNAIKDKNDAIDAIIGIQHLLREEFSADNPASDLLQQATVS